MSDTNKRGVAESVFERNQRREAIVRSPFCSGHLGNEQAEF
jgi:hypothetical protein